MDGTNEADKKGNDKEDDKFHGVCCFLKATRFWYIEKVS